MDGEIAAHDESVLFADTGKLDSALPGAVEGDGEMAPDAEVRLTLAPLQPAGEGEYSSLATKPGPAAVPATARPDILVGITWLESIHDGDGIADRFVAELSKKCQVGV